MPYVERNFRGQALALQPLSIAEASDGTKAQLSN
jgi:hypothetical protein